MFIRDISGKWWLPHLSRSQRARMNNHKNARLTPSDQRNSVLTQWLHHYNWHRPHMGIGGQPPISRVPLNNVVGLHN
ncbi:integrase core domain-containing protein [Stenotrophomonas sp. SAU14A_NAIMI4_8]|uniref:integrase core domain-containing protein n=1 Tax=Stenotrophomonas sp. SAU14A_NAIMI4_8 TaxID=2072409 RepID=UPI0022782364|nr:integrase core domain-containing protein [Stenotrophomonas sp. SAU14A_NAIMI4_8]